MNKAEGRPISPKDLGITKEMQSHFSPGTSVQTMIFLRIAVDNHALRPLRPDQITILFGYFFENRPLQDSKALKTTVGRVRKGFPEPIKDQFPSNSYWFLRDDDLPVKVRRRELVRRHRWESVENIDEYIEVRRKESLALFQNPEFKARHQAGIDRELQRKNNSRSKRNRTSWKDPAYREKMSAPKSQEVKDKMSAGQTERHARLRREREEGTASSV